MGWRVSILEAASDNVVTPQEVTSIVSGTINSAIQGLVMVGMMSMVVKGFYGMLGPKKFAEQKEEILGMVGKIW